MQNFAALPPQSAPAVGHPMSAVPLDQQIRLVVKRIAALEKFLAICPTGIVEYGLKKQELEEWEAVMASLVGLEAVERIEG